jgi:hypothetical protein
MQTTPAPAKRSNYPFSVVLILILHLALGYVIYNKVTQTAGSNHSTGRNGFAVIL